MTPNLPQWREWWVTKDEYSNRALVRDPGEKWKDDICGLPNASKWIHVIEIAAYRLLEAELGLARSELSEAEAELDNLKDETANSGKFAQDQENTVAALKAELKERRGYAPGILHENESLRAQLAMTNSNWPHEKKAIEALNVEREINAIYLEALERMKSIWYGRNYFVEHMSVAEAALTKAAALRGKA